MAKQKEPYKSRRIKGIPKTAVYGYEIVYAGMQIYRDSLASRCDKIAAMLNDAYAVGYAAGKNNAIEILTK